MFGICLASLGYELYGSYALNLAISLKVLEPDVPITLICDSKSTRHLKDEEKVYFDEIILIDEDYFDIGYQVIKLLINKYTPYESTMYMDVDSIWLDKKPSLLFEKYCNCDFKIGLAGEYETLKNKRPNNNYTFWGEPKSIIQYHNLVNNLPQTVSGFYFFKKCKLVDDIFEEALKVYYDPNAPTKKWSNGKADEYCLNVALSKLNYSHEKFSVFYFDKMDGRMDSSVIYDNYWGIALGGNRVRKNISQIYDRLVDNNCNNLGLEKRHYHIDKADVLKQRLKN